ncbi:MAG TPA: protein kinase [Longimicrobium sp.]|nr:protein kinase [Longimicrobium sp.]
MPGLESLLKGRDLAGRYRIEEVIGRGGMGAVYRATDLRLGRSVAVKVVTTSAGNDAALRERLRERFLREAKAAANLPHHPNVVPVYDYGADEEVGLDYIVMELLRGEDLASRLQRSGAPPMGLALRILRDAARGVAVGHRQGLIHRDVKPGNVFLVEGDSDADMQVRVLDFGIAKAIAEEDTQTALTQDGRAPHSPAYASPEQLRGEARLTPASDVFSLGAVGYQLLTNSRPFTDADRNRMGAGIKVDLPPLLSRNPRIPGEIEQIVRRAMHPDPAQRFESAGALADALETPLRHLSDTPLATAVPAAAAAGVMAADDDRTALAGDDDRTMLAPPPGMRPPAPVHRPPPPGTVVSTGAPVIPRPRHRPPVEKRSPWPVVLGLALLLALGAIGFLLWQQRQNRAPGPLVADTTQVDTAQQDSIDPTDHLAMSMEVRRLLLEGRPQDALSLAAGAVQLAPDNADYRDQLGYTLLRLGRYAEAAAQLEQGNRLDRRHDLIYSHLAEARLAMGDTLNAVKALEGFIEITQNARERETALRRLEALRTRPPETIPVPVDTPQPPQPVPLDPLREEPRDTIRFRDPR